MVLIIFNSILGYHQDENRQDQTGELFFQLV